MCGIAGIRAWSAAGEEELSLRAEAMAAALRHRGPDDGGLWVDAAAGIALGFRRLSIIDLSACGAQPMHSASGRYVIVFNGEIYNFERLRAELPPQSWRGHSDTEVMLACIEAWGLAGALERFIGMFAFALWDTHTRTLSLVRDRLGVKPLYYALTKEAISFASELKALRGGEIDRGALALYARYGYVPAPWSIYANVRKVLPGHVLTIGADGREDSRAYWDASKTAERAAAARFEGSEDDAVDALESVLLDAVRLRLIADVPLGLFLSGGADSSLIAALMKREAGEVATFTIGFRDLPSEAPYAAAVAKHLGTRHTESIITGDDALNVIPQMASMYDEPCGDSSAIPTYLVAKLARGSVTVALSGDGGDEIFGGYHRYFLGQRLNERVDRVPRALRTPLGRALRTVARLQRGNLGDRMRGLGSALVLDDPIARFLSEVGPSIVEVRDAPQRAFALTDRARWPKLKDSIELMMFLDAVSFLPDDILAKVDRASMAVSLEVREPLLDHRVVELAWSLPLAMKVREREGKRIMRRLLRRYFPDAMIDRDKAGFGLPLAFWLRGPLRDWARSLADPARVAREGWFDAASIRRLWEPGNEDVLWRVVMFQQWLGDRRS